MNYLPIEELKNAWIFRHKSLPLSEQQLSKIKPLAKQRANTLWDAFISRQVDHPDFFKKGDWPADKSNWVLTENWEKTWDDDDAQELPQPIVEHLNWDNNTVVYYCCARNYIIETTWANFKSSWKNFLFMSDGSILVGKKRKEAVQFLSNGNYKLGEKSV